MHSLPLAAAIEGRSLLPMILIGAALMATFVAIAFELVHGSPSPRWPGAIVAVVLALGLGVAAGASAQRTRPSRTSPMRSRAR